MEILHQNHWITCSRYLVFSIGKKSLSINKAIKIRGDKQLVLSIRIENRAFSINCFNMKHRQNLSFIRNSLLHLNTQRICARMHGTIVRMNINTYWNPQWCRRITCQFIVFTFRSQEWFFHKQKKEINLNTFSHILGTVN